MTHFIPNIALTVAVATPCWPRTGLGDDARLTHALGQQNLAHGVVDLVRTGVVQVFALEINLRATKFLGQAFSKIQRGRAAERIR